MHVISSVLSIILQSLCKISCSLRLVGFLTEIRAMIQPPPQFPRCESSRRGEGRCEAQRKKTPVPWGRRGMSEDKRQDRGTSLKKEATFEIILAFAVKIAFVDVTPCSLTEVYRRFRETCCLCSQGSHVSWRQQASKGERTLEGKEGKNEENMDLECRRKWNM
jgi:hypothetical protein